MMSTFRLRPLCIAATALMAGLPFAQDLWAQTAPPPIVVPQVTPRLNDPGPQLTTPQPAKPAPPVGAGVQNVPQPSADSLRRPSRHQATKNRHVSRTHPSGNRHTVTAKKSGACSYEHCIARCWASGQQIIVGRKGGNSCSDVCKRRGCGDYDLFLRDWLD